MTSKTTEQTVDQETRDKVFNQLKNMNDNNNCLDCQKKNPKWTSIHLGIHLCLDCAGKHRQYGVIYSFIKSINLDAWNRKQLLYMEKGGNSRALDYFRKKGVITPTNKHIDYRSPIVQQYKAILTDEVQMELGGVKPKLVEQKNIVPSTMNEGQIKSQEKKIQILTAEQVQPVGDKPKKKKNPKKIGAKQIVIDDSLFTTADNGVPTQEKDKIVKQYQKKKDEIQIITSTGETKQISNEPQTPKIQQPKQLSKEEANKKIEQLKQKSNVKAISSDQFKDTSVDNLTLKQNLNKFQGSASISSSAFFDKPEEQGSGQVMENIKDYVSNTGEKWLSKIPGLSGYFNK